MPDMLTTSQAAAILGVSRRRVHELIKLGTIQAEKPGRDWQVDPASVEAYKNSPRAPGRRPSKNKLNVAENNAQADPPHPKAE